MVVQPQEVIWGEKVHPLKTKPRRVLVFKGKTKKWKGVRDTGRRAREEGKEPEMLGVMKTRGERQSRGRG